MKITAYKGPDALVAAKSATPGLYIVQSESYPHYVRVGQSGSLRARTKQHSEKSGLIGYKQPDFCQIHRPWFALWVAVLPTSQPYARLVCEDLLTAEVGSRFPMIAGSSFELSANELSELIDIGYSLLPKFERIYDIQSRSRFQKVAYREALLIEKGLKVNA